MSSSTDKSLEQKFIVGELGKIGHQIFDFSNFNTLRTCDFEQFESCEEKGTIHVEISIYSELYNFGVRCDCTE